MKYRKPSETMDEQQERREVAPEISLSAESGENGQNRRQIALETLARYSGVPASQFQKFILLTNFPLYVDTFAEICGVPATTGSVLRSAHCEKSKISIIDYRVGAPMAALVIDVLSYTNPQTVVMLGLCGGLHRKHRIGDFLIPVAAIRDEGASRHYMPMQVPSLPAFMVQQFISQELMEQGMQFNTGVLHTTDYRMWEFDEAFKSRLREEKASAIDMECSALFTAGFSRKVPVGALMLISDLPMEKHGIKTQESAQAVLQTYTKKHLTFGMDALIRMRKLGRKEKINFRRFHF